MIGNTWVCFNCNKEFKNDIAAKEHEFTCTAIPTETPKTLRDEFAMAALSQLLSNGNVNGIEEVVASAAYKFADAMLRQRAKKP